MQGRYYNTYTVFFAILLVINFLQPVLVYSKNENGKLKTLVIDAGHGGQDPGASGKVAKEKDIVLAVALKVGQLINENHPEVKTIFTRSTDVFIPLHERADIANRNNADLFISIHANANKNHAIFGSETYSMGLHTNEKNMEVAKKENAVITFEKDYSSHYEGYDPNSAESFIIFSLMQNTYMSQSLDFAAVVQNNFLKKAQRIDRGVRQAGFLVLWKTTMPSVLIELGFVTNEEEEQFLLSEKGQNELAHSIYNSFVDYKNKIESKSMFTVNLEDTNNIHSVANIIDTVTNYDTVVYKIQIFSSQQRKGNSIPELKKCRKIKGFCGVDEIKMNNVYKYTVGNSLNFDEILQYSKEVKKVFPEAFIIAVKNGKIISLSEALNKSN